MIGKEANKSTYWKHIVSVLLLTFLMMMGGCGESDDNVGTTGDLVIGITDAEGDFLNYTPK